MLALYIHIPFCVRKCKYCDFLSFPASEGQREEYLGLLIKELQGYRIGEGLLAAGGKIQSVFIGGGTPNCLSPGQLARLGEAIRELLEDTNSTDVEYTMEANPGLLKPGHIPVMREMGVNRVSLGLQSAQNRELAVLGRIHTYEDFLESYALLSNGGFDNLNVDVMADIPGQTLESYGDTLQKVLSLGPGHISSYSLIVEEGTPFYEMWQRGELAIPDEETDREMYLLTEELLGKQGYHRYEISNYAREGRECRHNLVYWRLGEYLGAGLGASSYLGGYRFHNPSGWGAYKKMVGDAAEAAGLAKPGKTLLAGKKLEVSFLRRCLAGKEDVHFVSRKEGMEEFLFLGLRTMAGVSGEEFKSRFGCDISEIYGEVLARLCRDGLVEADGEYHTICLTPRGIDVSNRVLAEFLLDM